MFPKQNKDQLEIENLKDHKNQLEIEKNRIRGKISYIRKRIMKISKKLKS